MRACAIASIFKVFPIGMRGDTIVSVDMKIDRGMYFSLMNEDGQENSRGEEDVNWIIKIYITAYDRHQKPFDIRLVDSVYIDRNDCEEDIKQLYNKAYNQTVKTYKHLELFEPIEISFGNFEAKYKDVEVSDDQIIYQKESYPITIAIDSSYYAFRYNEYLKLYSLPPAIGTVRKYGLKDREIIVVHTQFGQKFVDKLNDPIIPFADIKACAYLEPILYHGNGIDYFFIKEKKK